MMQVSKDFYIKCDICGCVTQVEAYSLDYEMASYERSMGEEIEYNSMVKYVAKGVVHGYLLILEAMNTR